MKVDYRKIYGESELVDTFLNKSAGEVIREIRQSQNLSLNQVEKKTEMFTKQTLSKYELGKSKIRMNVFFELAKIYNIEPKELYEKINMRYLSKLSQYTDAIMKGGIKNESRNKKTKR
jgi:transcriptional regulator with XRE-family HTH domain